MADSAPIILCVFSGVGIVLSVNGQPLSPTRRTLRPRLNPAFVCWLMGWPGWWTRAEPINSAVQEMESWRYRLRSRLAFCLAESMKS